MKQLITVNPVVSKKLKFIQAIKERNPGVDKPIISLNTVRVQEFLTDSKSSYKIKLKDVGAPTSELEQRLDNGQMFCPLYYSVRVQKGAIQGGNSNNQEANFIPFTYVDRQYFNGTDGTDFEYAALEKVFQGKLTLSKSGSDLDRQLDTELCKFTPQQQYVPAAVAGTPNDVFPQYGPTYEERGYAFMYNDVVLIGDDDNNITFDLGPGNINLIGGIDPNTGNKVDIRYLGFLYYGENFGKSSNFCSTQ